MLSNGCWRIFSRLKCLQYVALGNESIPHVWALVPNKQFIKVHIFWDGHKILRNLHRRFDCYYMGQIYGGDFAKNLWPSQNIWTLSFNIHTYLSIRYQWVATFWHFQVLFLQRMNNTIPWQKCAAFIYFLTSSLVVCT